MKALLLSLGLLVQLSLASSLAAQPVLRVPQDVNNLQAALARVVDGGIIELAAGTYPSPPNAFRIFNADKGFTIRAAAGAAVVLTGEGQRPILRYENSNPGRGRRVYFRGLTFRDGFSSTESVGGAVSLITAQASFVGCTFADNRTAAPSTGGGALLLHEGAEVVLVDSTLAGNSSTNRGGAIESQSSTLYIHHSRLEGNRVNLPGHAPRANGGAILAVDSRLRVSESQFVGNQAASSGGALIGFGVWNADPQTPAAEILISNTSFVDNSVVADSCCAVSDPTTGGAIHVEDQATLRLFETRFEGNQAEQAGAISSYRAIIEVEDSIFRGNLASGSATVGGAGGAIYVTSADFPDSSTDFGAINRRPGELHAVRTLFQGRFGGLDATAATGGCVAVAGDVNRRFGDGGVAQDGGLAANRAKASFEQVVVFDCAVDQGPDGFGGLGGGISAQLVDLTMTDSLVLDSDARSPDIGGGGGMGVLLDSLITLRDSVFAGNTAYRGGGLLLNGSELDLADSAFIANEISPGQSEPVAQSRGAAIFSTPRISSGQPGRAGDVFGVVRQTLFAHNVGLPIFETDRDSAPINRLRYDGNRFHPAAFGSLVFANTLDARNGITAAQLNSLVVTRSGAPSTDKSEVANQSSGSAPGFAKVLVVPRTPSTFGGAGPATAFAAFAWSGSSATLNGQSLATRSGLRELPSPGTRLLAVIPAAQDTATLAAGSCSSGGLLCLNGARFGLDVVWRDFQGRTGLGHAVPLTGDTGYFTFFDPANVELVAKVLDARAINAHYWLFYGSLSSVEYEILALDRVTGKLNRYRNPRGTLASVGDTEAFPQRAGGAPAQASTEKRGAGERQAQEDVEDQAIDRPDLSIEDESIDSTYESLDPRAACQPSGTRLCLNGQRFAIEMTWRDSAGATRPGQAVKLTEDTGYFYFLNPSNVEVVIKVLDGRPLNGHFWVFFGALSNVRYEIRVTDTLTGFTKTYTNPAGRFASVGDTRAIPAD